MNKRYGLDPRLRGDDVRGGKTIILFVHHGKGLGGAPLSLLYLLQGLDHALYHPIVVFLYPSEIIELYKSHGIQTIGPLSVMDFPHTKIWWLRWYHIMPMMRMIKDFFKTLYSVAPALLKQLRPDLVHLNTSSLPAWAIAAKRCNIPVVWHIREPLADGYLGLRKRFITWCVKQYATTIVPICRNDAQPWLQLPKTAVIYNAVKPDMFAWDTDPSTFLAKHQLSPLRPRILFVGGISQEKGTHSILKIFKQLLVRVPDAQLLLAGYSDTTSSASLLKNVSPDARYKQAVVKQLQDLGNRVKLLGPIHDIPAAMAASNVVVFPATIGHFARPVIEAGFMKKPVIASALPPLDELVQDTITGFLLPPHDTHAWVETLALLLTDQVYAARMGQAAYAHCLATFGIHQQQEKIQSVYLAVFKKGEARG